MHLLHSVTDVSSVRYSWMQRKAQLQANSAASCGHPSELGLVGSWIEGSQETVANVKVVLRWGLSENHKAVLFFAPKLVCDCLGDASQRCSLNRNMTKHYTIIPPIWPIPVEISGKKRSWWTIAWQTKLLLNSERDTFGECLFAPLFTAWTLIHFHQGTSIAHFAQDLQHCDVVMVCTVSWQGVQHMLPAGHTDTLQGSLVPCIFRQMDLNDRHSERLLKRLRLLRLLTRRLERSVGWANAANAANSGGRVMPCAHLCRCHLNRYGHRMTSDVIQRLGFNKWMVSRCFKCPADQIKHVAT